MACSQRPGPADQFDYIVVGGGSAGCVAAARLATSGARVLLLEAGGRDTSPFIRMPAGYMRMITRATSELSMHISATQPSLGGRSVFIPQGAVLGGGSSVNAMLYMRGTREDYDNWAQRCPGWGWNDLLPHFLRQEGNQRLGLPLHGVDGPLKVSDLACQPCEATRAFVRSVQTMGVPYVADLNDGIQRGVSSTQTTTFRGRRWSAVDAFIRPLGEDPDLTVTCGAAVDRLIFEGDRAIGVAFRTKNGSLQAFASSEVILTAGALVTPKILMLSGIGPGSHLASLGIPVRVDSPGVGANLQDHCSIPIYAAANVRVGYYGDESGLRLASNVLRYALYKDGPLSTNGSEAHAFVNPLDPGTTATLQLYCLGVLLNNPDVGVKADHGMTMMVNLLRPRSRGDVRLRSANPADMPIVNPNFLDDPADLRMVVAGIRFLQSVAGATPLRRLIRKMLAPSSDLRSDAQLSHYARRVVITNFHPVGTCRMGADVDAGAVLDTQLRVRGIRSLRVFDASMMPTIISANTNAPVMAIADRAVDLMLGLTTHKTRAVPPVDGKASVGRAAQSVSGHT